MTNKESKKEREREGEPVETYYSTRFEGKEKGWRGGREEWVFALISHRLKFIDRMLRLLLRQGSSNL